ncbi:dynamin family protein [Paenibacillus terrigena]|uniref:dynamin family protein n=1 Tax=Paenibacillus terrigena TaxID=369333 RepID=UPI00035D9794|nr:dynamin family protein [Paenibacillus terrigena]
MRVLTTNELQNVYKLSLEPLAAQLAEAGDEVHAGKMKDLMEKWGQAQFTIAFCGHFSAGKSSLINRICGKRILPSSPIPTSANLVRIHNGQPQAIITKMPTNPGAVGEKISVPLNDLEAYCVNGVEFESVDLYEQIAILGERGTLLDTPGVDSTDDAHRMSTESALHLADVVFYVMDYNHVQSEINFTFAKQLADWGKPIYLIVNQIDKHRERELSFDAYRTGVEQAFAAWNIKPAGILYLSLKHPEHPHDEWEKLNWLMGALMTRQEALREHSIVGSAAQVVEAHLRLYASQQEPKRQELMDRMGGSEQASRLAEELAALEAEEQRLAGEASRVQAQFRDDLNRLLDQANIIPAQTRDLADTYLQCRKPGFKVGFLFTAGKTIEEQTRRLKALYDHFMEQVTAHVDWHVGDLLRKLSDLSGVPEADWASTFAQLSQEMTPAWLAARVSEGASFTNEYTMNYSKQISTDAKALYRKQALAIADDLLEQLRRGLEAQAAVVREQHMQLLARSAALAELRSLEHSERTHAERLRALGAAPQGAATSGMLPDVAQAPARSSADAAAAAQGAASAAAQAAPAPAQRATAAQGAPVAAPAASAAARAREHARQAAARLRSAKALLAPYPAMKSLGAGLARKAERLEDSRFTIALFGAFSAGKSSFANALIGEDVLPVSPNPTTAAINQLMAPTEDFPHGTAEIIMKTREAMLEDIAFSLSMLGLEMPSEGRLLETIRSLKPEQVQPAGRPHYSFLKAVAKGWVASESLLGQSFQADLPRYRAYVAEEDKSCFVSVIHLHYSCPLTDQGIVLVDTPGADSINARHTGVSFNYIKNADAILFVTYYNHAFSQADRQFLQQLGRVKDAFELDKMFFIVNAADLAGSDDELQGVLTYVENQLLEYGIRFPRLYPVSSLQALDAKLNSDEPGYIASGLPAFEQEFIRFTIEELGQLAIQSGEQDLVRAERMIRQWIDAAQADEQEKQRQLAELQLSEQQAGQHCAGLQRQAAVDAPLLTKETQELLYYVKQRIRYRFSDLFNYAFNPATLRSDSQDLKLALKSCVLEIHRLIALELSQELLATTIRIEQAALKMAARHAEQAIQDVQAVLPSFEMGALLSPQSSPPVVDENLRSPEVDFREIWSIFKNPKSFFEGEGKARLRQVMESAYVDSIQAAVQEHERGFVTHYSAFSEQVLEHYAAQMHDAAAEQCEGIRSSLVQQTDTESLEELIRALRTAS